MIKVVKTKNYFLGLLYLILAVIFTIFFLSMGLVIVGLILTVAIIAYIVMGVAYLFRKKRG